MIWYDTLTSLTCEETGKRLTSLIWDVIHKGEIVMRYLPYLPGKRLGKDLPHMWRLTKKGEIDIRSSFNHNFLWLWRIDNLVSTQLSPDNIATDNTAITLQIDAKNEIIYAKNKLRDKRCKEWD